jgi:predicted RNA-binding Zn ribbon-like protein
MGRSLALRTLHELEPLNRLLERDEAFNRISRRRRNGGDRLELQLMRRWRSPESLLLPIGEALAKFVCEEDFANVKACEGHGCTLMFADHTRRREDGAAWRSAAIVPSRPRTVTGSGTGAEESNTSRHLRGLLDYDSA